MSTDRLPSFVKSGDPIKASGYNDIVKYIRTSEEKRTFKSGQNRRKSQPFDLVSVFYDNADLKIRIKSGTITKGSNSYFVYYNTDEGYKPLLTGDSPDINVPDGKTEQWLGVDTNEFTLNWYDTNKYSNHVSYVGRFTFERDGDELKSIKHTNLYSAPVSKGDNPFLITAWTDYNKATKPSGSAPTECKLTISNGYVCGFDNRFESPANIIKKKVKCGDGWLNDGETPVISAENYDYVYLKIITNNKGIIQDFPEIIVTADEQESTHYLPPPDPVNGVYYYKLGKVYLKEFTSDDGTYYQFSVEQDHTGDIYWQPEQQGYNLDIIVYRYTLITEPPYIELVDSVGRMYWRNGLFVGTEEEFETSPDVENERPLISKYVSNIY